VSAPRLTKALLLSLSLVPVPTGWDHPGYDAEDSFYSPGRVHDQRWLSHPLVRHGPFRCANAGVRVVCGSAAPLDVGGRVFAADRQGISVYRVADGVLAWRFDWLDPDDATTTSMAVAGDALIAANIGCQSQSDPERRGCRIGRGEWSRAGRPTPRRRLESLMVDKGVAVVCGSSRSDAQTTIAYRSAEAGGSGPGRAMPPRGSRRTGACYSPAARPLQRWRSPPVKSSGPNPIFGTRKARVRPATIST
jgi:hypothetical protein